MRICLTAVALFATVAVARPACAQETKPPAQKKVELPDMLNAAHILVSHKAAEGADQNGVTRSKEEALKLAKQYSELLKKNGKDFEKLAKEKSDGPSGKWGGNLGNFKPGQMVPAFTETAIKLKVGGVSDPVESQFGYHVIMRKPLLNAHNILVSFKGSAQSRSERSKEDALKLATDIAKQCKAAGADFSVIARKNSEGPYAARGGQMGLDSPLLSRVPEIMQAVLKLKVNEISAPLETPFGYHVMVRRPVPRLAAAKHILVQWKGSGSAKPSVTRTKEEALKRLQECIAKLKAGSKFEDLAKEYSDGPSGKNGGDLETFREGRMVPPFDAALFKMKVGGVSSVVETDFGYHIIYRYK